ncbi:hypothetical protein ANN_04517 [Periplaneta americana]|uniref:DUF4817 domain-containing protein n=1 Tax=Periplaneta americana TaxID=6978 RepID=A0ABQ8TAB5_PERAM|nr:hypothetical protein ANN_04517 [Periplaneta americana]
MVTVTGMREQQSKNINCVFLIVQSQVGACLVMFIDATGKEIHLLNHIVKDDSYAITWKVISLEDYIPVQPQAFEELLIEWGLVFLCRENETVGNIRKRFKKMYGDAAVDRSTEMKHGSTILNRRQTSYSPDLTPCHCHLFGKVKESLRGTRFEDNDSLVHGIKEWLRRVGPDFFRADSAGTSKVGFYLQLYGASYFTLDLLSDIQMKKISSRELASGKVPKMLAAFPRWIAIPIRCRSGRPIEFILLTPSFSPYCLQNRFIETRDRLVARGVFQVLRP